VRPVKTFSQFVNENSHHTERALDIFPKLGEPLLDLVNKVKEAAARMQDRRTYWYDRESRDISGHHYAVDVKTYGCPSLEEWREAIGEPYEDEDVMYDRWNQWLELEIDDFRDNVFLPKFSDEFDDIKMGGRSGGWMCLMINRNSDPESLVDDLETYVDSYTEKVDSLDEEEVEEIARMLSLSDDELARMMELGIINPPESYESLMTEYRDALFQAKQAISSLKMQEEACIFVKNAHDEWDKESTQNFLEHEKESYY